MFLKPSVYQPLILSVILVVFRQFGGIATIIIYASGIVSDIGFKNATVDSIVFAAAEVVATGILCAIVNKFGRRKLHIFPEIVSSVTMAIVGASFCIPGFSKSLDLLFISLNIMAYSIGWLPIPSLIMSEIFPSHVRSIACGITSQVNRLSMFVVVKTFPQLNNDFHSYGVFFIYGGMCFLCTVVVFFFLPETKYRTLEEIEELFSDHAHLKTRRRESNGYGVME